MDNNSVLEYVQNKLNDLGLKDLPVSEMYSDEDWENAKKAYEEGDLLSLMYILALGFANGVNYNLKK